MTETSLQTGFLQNPENLEAAKGVVVAIFASVAACFEENGLKLQDYKELRADSDADNDFYAFNDRKDLGAYYEPYREFSYGDSDDLYMSISLSNTVMTDDSFSKDECDISILLCGLPGKITTYCSHSLPLQMKNGHAILVDINNAIPAFEKAVNAFVTAALGHEPETPYKCPVRVLGQPA